LRVPRANPSNKGQGLKSWFAAARVTFRLTGLDRKRDNATRNDAAGSRTGLVRADDENQL
jgi:hypothetical protein